MFELRGFWCYSGVHLVGSEGGYCWNWCSEGIQVHHYCDTLSVRESSSASTICTCAKVCHNSETDGAIWAGTPHTPLHLIQVARLRQKESTQGCLSFAHCSSVCARSETDPGYSFSWLVPVLSSQEEIELSFSQCHLCTWSKLHQMFLKCGSFGALSQLLITEHFLVSSGGLLGAFQSPASRVCGHFSESQIPLQCGQSCPMVKCL